MHGVLRTVRMGTVQHRTVPVECVWIIGGGLEGTGDHLYCVFFKKI